MRITKIGSYHNIVEIEDIGKLSKVLTSPNFMRYSQCIPNLISPLPYDNITTIGEFFVRAISILGIGSGEKASYCYPIKLLDKTGEKRMLNLKLASSVNLLQAESHN